MKPSFMNISNCRNILSAFYVEKYRMVYKKEIHHGGKCNTEGMVSFTAVAVCFTYESKDYLLAGSIYLKTCN
jgi:hypothetical protein